jgi:hypothetical protein
MLRSLLDSLKGWAARSRAIDLSDLATVRRLRARALAGLALIGTLNLTLLGWGYPALVDLGA